MNLIIRKARNTKTGFPVPGFNTRIPRYKVCVQSMVASAADRSITRYRGNISIYEFYIRCDICDGLFHVDIKQPLQPTLNKE